MFLPDNARIVGSSPLDHKSMIGTQDTHLARTRTYPDPPRMAHLDRVPLKDPTRYVNRRLMKNGWDGVFFDS